MANSPLYGRASLLDRLIDWEPKQQREYPPLRAQTWPEFQQSLLRDLAWLLNTHCPFNREDLEAGGQRSVIDYGVPDIHVFYTHNAEDQRQVEKILEEAIEAFEPRLKEVRVQLGKVNDYRELGGYIEAEVIFNDVAEPLSFPIFTNERGSWVVAPGDE